MTDHNRKLLSENTITPALLAELAGMASAAAGVREEIRVTAPFTGETLGSIPACTAEDILAAVTRGRAAQPAWAARPFAARRDILLRFHDLVLKHQNELLDLIQLETGKARLHALEEVLDVAICSRYYAIHGWQHLRPKRRRGALPLLTRTVEQHHPVGVAAIISPWNYPLSLAITDAIPALLAGNCVVLKPDHQTSFTALYGLKLLREAGLSPDVMQIITGDGRIVGTPLLNAVDVISFTGSTATGRHIAELAGRRLVKCSLELGGKNPLLILDDANLDRAVNGAIQGCFANCGQLCMSFERLYVQSGIYDRFVSAFVQKTAALRLGSSLDYQADLGSLTSTRQLATVTGHLQDALEKGASLLCGGKHRPDIGPFFFEPTILSGVTPAMQLFAEETFGPVVALYRFHEPDEAVAAANDSAYGLNAAIWTSDIPQGKELAGLLKCGTVNINEGYAAAWGSVDAPMGGMKDSGLGRRHGAEGILKYTEAQTVAVQRLLPIGPLPGMSGEAYARLMTRLLALVRRLPGLR